MQARASPFPRAREALRSGAALALLVFVVGATGGGLLIAGELSSVAKVEVLTSGTCEELAEPRARDSCDQSGLELHGGALLLLGAAAVAMAAGAARGARRPAALALLVIAALTLAVALLRDLPRTDDTGLVGQSYESAKAIPQLGFYLELAGAVLCAAAGGLRLLRPARR